MFQGWDNFFFLMGSAAAGLIGLLFVVVTLTSGADRSQILATASIFFVVALVGFVSATRATYGIAMPRPGAEPPHWSDFWMYGATPTALCFALCAASLAVGGRVAGAPHAFAALLLLLLLVGIRNAWDLVTWIAPKRPNAAN